jgi:AraC-like DNA-binding protein
MPTLVKADERHYTPKEIAQILRLDPKSVRDLFRKEEGVVRIGNPDSTFRKRAHTTLRIPESVFERVHRRMSVKG